MQLEYVVTSRGKGWNVEARVVEPRIVKGVKKEEAEALAAALNEQERRKQA